jgi:hypothetical protein
VSPSITLERSGSVGLCLIIWAVCGAISLTGKLVCHNIKLVLVLYNVPKCA